MEADRDTRPPLDITLICDEFGPALELLRELGLRLDVIYPADEPHSALLSREGQSIRLTSRPEEKLPNAPPPFQPEFVLSRAGDRGGEGRAGMHYRDLIPSRLGGRFIASHIAVPNGPVADWVHYHRLVFQLIAVRRGWVRLVYEDQGDPFVMRAGDVVLQPPEIRHQVLESGGGLEVIEISCPALHPTFADHAMKLPNRRGDRSRCWTGQSFIHFLSGEGLWAEFHGGEAMETGLSAASGGLVDARWLRPAGTGAITVPPSGGELVFGFVADGSATIERAGERHALGAADSFVVPPSEPWILSDLSSDFRLLHFASGRLGGLNQTAFVPSSSNDCLPFDP